MDEHDDPLVGLAAALTWDPPLAADLLAEVDALAPPGPAEDHEDSRRALLVQRFLRRKHPAPAAAPQDVADAGEPDPSDELRGVRARLDGLAPYPRAVLVLRHSQRLTVADLARTTERTPAAVNRALDTAEAAVGADPATLALVLAQAPRPSPEAVQAAGRRFAVRRRRYRGRVVLAVTAVAALLVGVGVLPGLLRVDPFTRAYGEWVHGFTLGPSSAFRVDGRSLSAGQDTLSLTWTDPARTSCDVTVTTEQARVAVPAGRPVEVAGRPARFLAPTDQDSGSLWLWVGPRTAARVSCKVSVEDSRLLEIATQLQFAPAPLELPFALRDLPPTEEVRTIFDYEGSVGVILTPAGQVDGSPDTLYISVPDLFDLAPREPTSIVTVGGARAEVVAGVDGQSVCWRADGKRICAGTFPQDATGNQKDRLLVRLVRTARLLELAPDLDDRSTWFDAREALPR